MVIVSAVVVANPNMTAPPQKPLAVEPTVLPTATVVPTNTPEPLPSSASAVFVTPEPTAIPTITPTPQIIKSVSQLQKALLTPTATPTPVLLPQAQCTNVKLYRVRGTQWIPIRDVSALSAGEKVTLAVIGATNQGIIDKARFRINGSPARWQETTSVNQYGEYYIDYALPKDAEALDIEAQIHHVSLGWY
jgi:hypothetical protein